MGTAQLQAVIPRCGHSTASAHARVTLLILCRAGSTSRHKYAGGWREWPGIPCLPLCEGHLKPCSFSSLCCLPFPSDILPVPLVCAAWVLALGQGKAVGTGVCLSSVTHLVVVPIS